MASISSRRIWVGIGLLLGAAVICLLLYSPVGSKDGGPIASTKLRIQTLSHAVNEYVVAFGGLHGLSKASLMGRNSKAMAFLEPGDGDLWIDAWGNAITLDIHVDRNEVVIRSLGPDGILDAGGGAESGNLSVTLYFEEEGGVATLVRQVENWPSEQGSKGPPRTP